VTELISAWVAVICWATCVAGSVARSGWLQVRSSTGYPAAATICVYSGYWATFSPISKKVAGTWYCSSTERIRGVNGPGPSSKVSAITRWPAVAPPPGACQV
jgi:hypothetical protein